MTERITYAFRTLPAGGFWRTALRLAILSAAAVAVLALALTTVMIVLPILLIGGVVLHYYLRRKFRLFSPRARARGEDNVIDAEYRVVEPGYRDRPSSAR